MSTAIQTNDHKICILLGVWGEKFINDFLNLSLASLLAPGNVPALANHYNTRFVFLTSSSDTDVFEKNLAFQTLKKFCEVQFIFINDLIVFGNYSTTLTLAYDRAIKQTGEGMLNTYFLFLTSDYIMADGSLQGVMRYIQKGYSGICAGNFQVIEDEINPFLTQHLDAKNHVLQLKPRKLLEYAFKNLHPIVIASLYDQEIAHNYHANRFFLRHDSQILVGRFYLLHMLCIKPETTDYRIGASCDYSFIPEMCPSGNIGVINDSDDYLVVEAQSTEHELGYINKGRYNFKKLVTALEEWTTKRHRENANFSIYFHTRDIHQKEKIIIEENLNNFINNLEKELKKYPEKPYFNHPYWKGAIQSFNKQNELLKLHNDYDYIDFFNSNKTLSPIKKLYYTLVGTPPSVFRWHYRWSEFNNTKKIFLDYLAQTDNKNLIVLYDSYYSEFMRYSAWLRKEEFLEHYFLKNLLKNQAKLIELEMKKFDKAILFITLDSLKNIKERIFILKKILKSNGKILIFIPNVRNHCSELLFDLRAEFINKINHIFQAEYHIFKMIPICNNLTLWASAIIYKINKIFAHSKKVRIIIYAFFGIFCFLFSFIRNILPNSNGGHCTGIALILEPDKEF